MAQFDIELVPDDEYAALENAVRAAEAASRERDIEELGNLNLVRFKVDLFNAFRPFGPHRQQFSLSVSAGADCHNTAALHCGFILLLWPALCIVCACMLPCTVAHGSLESLDMVLDCNCMFAGV